MVSKWVFLLVVTSCLLTVSSVLRAQVNPGNVPSTPAPPASHLPIQMPKINWVDIKITLDRQESELKQQKAEIIREAAALIERLIFI